MNDSAIVDLYLDRDETAIAYTSEKYGKQLFNLANRILHSLTAAEECENDTYLEAWQTIPPHEPRTYLFAFLGRIARHLAIDACRKNEAQKRQALFCELTAEMGECIPAEQSSVEEIVDAKEVGLLIGTFLETCSTEQQNVFVRRYWYFDSISEISRRYGFSQSKVKMMLLRMREDLREYLRKEDHTI